MKTEKGLVELEGSFLGREKLTDFRVEVALLSETLMVHAELKIRVNRHMESSESEGMVDKLGEALRAVFKALGSAVDVDLVLNQTPDGFTLIRDFHKRQQGGSERAE